MTKQLKSIIYEWKQVAGVKDFVSVSAYPRSELVICTTRPGFFIGKEGALYQEYWEKLVKVLPHLERIKFVETDSHFFL